MRNLDPSFAFLFAGGQPTPIFWVAILITLSVIAYRLHDIVDTLRGGPQRRESERRQEIEAQHRAKENLARRNERLEQSGNAKNKLTALALAALFPYAGNFYASRKGGLMWGAFAVGVLIGFWSWPVIGGVILLIFYPLAVVNVVAEVDEYNDAILESQATSERHMNAIRLGKVCIGMSRLDVIRTLGQHSGMHEVTGAEREWAAYGWRYGYGVVMFDKEGRVVGGTHDLIFE